MAKVVVFNINDGNFEQGFPVILQINEEGKQLDTEMKGCFPSAPDIPELYRYWQEKYNNLELVQRTIKVDSAQINNVSTPGECREAAQDLKERLKRWFQEADFLQLCRFVQEELGKDESARIIFQTDNEILKKLPWHLWDLFQSRPKAWLSLSAIRAKYSQKTLKKPVRILAILVSNKGINPDLDENLLNKLPGAKVQPLRNPTQRELCERLRQEEDPWDILYFAGHSSSQDGGNDGQIQINNIDSPSLSELRNAFQRAIKNGLSLAIFNSCDGLGLANQLALLAIPQVIVMKEPVPDRVAQEFLQEFLRLFSSGKPFYLAMREAQESLEFIENQFPCASWLPVICQNPAAVSPRWPQSPVNFKKIQRRLRRLWREHRVASLVILFIIGVLLLNLMFSLVKTSIINIISPPPPVEINIKEYTSRGERILLNQPPTSNAKTQGTKDFESALNTANSLKWDSAIKNFIISLQQNPNDPETLIYLNNAIAMKAGNPLTIAVSTIKNEGQRSEEIWRGVAHAQSKLNCGNINDIIGKINNQQTPNCTGGINNRLLLVEIIDETDEPDTFKKIVHEIVNRKNQDILAVIGPYSSSSAIAVKEYHQKLIFISPTSTSNQINRYNKLDIFRTATNDKTAARQLFDYVEKEIEKTGTTQNIKAVVAYVKGNYYSESLTDEFKSSLPQGDYIDRADLLSDSDDRIIKKIKDAKANVLLLVPASGSNTLRNALNVVTLIPESNINNLRILGGDAMYDSSMAQKIVEQTKLVIAVPWHRNKTSIETTDFEKEAEQLWGENKKINWRTVMSYDATQAIIHALKQSRGDTNTKNIRSILSSQKGKFSAPGAIVKVEFNTAGDRRPQTDGESTKLGVLVKIECNINGSACDFVKNDD